MKKTLVSILVGLLLSLTGVAGLPSEAQAATHPLCSKVWVKGHVLPKHYTWCRNGVVWTMGSCHMHATKRHGDWLWARNGMVIRAGKNKMYHWMDTHNC
jgi:hypothetical protein